MADGCAVKNPVNIDKVEYLQKYADDFVKVLALVESPIKSLDRVNILKATDKSEALLKTIFGESFNSSHLKRKTDKEKAVAVKAIDGLVEDIYRAMENPIDIMQKVEHGSRVLAGLKTARRLSQVDSSLEHMWHFIQKAAGFDPVEHKSADIFGQRINKLSQWGPSREAFRIVNEIEEYANKNVQRLSDRARRIVDNASTMSILKEVGIDSFDKISEVFPFFDRKRKAQLMSIYNTNDEGDAFISFLQNKGLYNESITKDNVTEVLLAFKTMQEDFNELNYGMPKVNENFTLAQATDDSALGFMRTLSDKIKSMHNTLSALNIDNTVMKQFERIDKALSEFVPIKDYVPSLGDKEDGIYSLLSSNPDDHIMLASWFNHRKEFISKDSLVTGNFIDSFVSNLAGTALMTKEFSNKFFYTFLEHARERDRNWFNSWERREVGIAVDQAIDIARDTANRKPPTTNAKRVKDSVSPILNVYATAVLAFPGSALRNLVSGIANMFWRLGNEVRGKDFKAALSVGDKTALMVNEYSNNFLRSLGMVSEYTVNKEVDKFADGHSSAVRDFFMKAADWNGDGGLPGRMWGFWKENLSMKGTEEKLREANNKLLYNRVKADLSLKGKLNPSPEEITSAINRHSDSVFYDINGALGNFSALNKPYMFRAFQDNATDAPAVLAGILLNVVYLFRHASIVTHENFSRAMANLPRTLDLGNPYKDKSAYVASTGQAGGVLLGLLIGAYEMAKDRLPEDSELPIINTGFTTALNPTEELDILPKMSIYAIKAFNNIPISDEEYADLKNESISYLAGFTAAGARFSKKNEFIHGKIDNWMRDSVDFRRLFTGLVDSYTTEEVGNKAIWDLKQKSFERQKNQWTIATVADPIWFIERLPQFYDMKSADKAAEWKFKRDLAESMIKTMFAGNFWISNEVKPSDYAYDNEFTTNSYYRYKSARGNFMKRNLPNAKLANDAMDYFLRYGSGGSRLKAKPRM